MSRATVDAVVGEGEKSLGELVEDVALVSSSVFLRLAATRGPAGWPSIELRGPRAEVGRVLAELWLVEEDELDDWLD